MERGLGGFLLEQYIFFNRKGREVLRNGTLRWFSLFEEQLFFYLQVSRGFTQGFATIVFFNRKVTRRKLVAQNEKSWDL